MYYLKNIKNRSCRSQTIYTMVEDDIIEEVDVWENKYFLQEMKNRVNNFENGKTQSISWEQIKAKARS